MIPIRPYRRSRRRGWPRLALWCALVAVLGVNAVAALQARAATHFVPKAPVLKQQFDVPLLQKVATLFTGVHVPRPVNHTTPADHHLPYEVRSIPVGANEQLEAWYVPHADSRGLVIMFAGYAGVKEGLLTPAAYLYQFGYSGLLVDFRGTGGSSGNTTTLGVREAEDVVAAFTYATDH